MPKKASRANSDTEPHPAATRQRDRPAAVDKPAAAKPAAAKPAAAKPAAKPAPQEPELFRVERILAERTKNTGVKPEYHIKWMGYDESHNSWEPQSGILDSKVLKVWKQSQADGGAQQVRWFGVVG